MQPPQVPRAITLLILCCSVLSGHAADKQPRNKLPSTLEEIKANTDASRVKYISSLEGHCRKAVFHTKNVTDNCKDHLWHAAYVHRVTFGFATNDTLVSFFGMDEILNKPDEYQLKLDGVIEFDLQERYEATHQATGICTLKGDPRSKAMIHCHARTKKGEWFEGRFDTNRLVFMMNQLTGEVIEDGVPRNEASPDSTAKPSLE
jgi:hypothetical protein